MKVLIEQDNELIEHKEVSKVLISNGALILYFTNSVNTTIVEYKIIDTDNYCIVNKDE